MWDGNGTVSTPPSGTPVLEPLYLGREKNTGGTNIEHSLLRLWQSLSFAWSRDRRASGKQPATWQGAPEALTTSWVSSVCSRSSHGPQGHRVLARPPKKDSAFCG